MYITKISPYRRKNNCLMLYINDLNKSNGVKISVAFGERIYSTKLTQGQKNVLNRFWSAFAEVEPIIKDFKPLAPHNSENMAELDCNVKFYITDNANVAGHNVGADGGYIEYEGNLYSLIALNEYLGGI